MNEEMAQLYKDVEHWLRLEKETLAELLEGSSAEVESQWRYKGRVEAHEFMLVMINSVTLLFGHTKESGIKPTDWGKKK
mgnify:CR=1 FL=1|tara:strand:+ start:1024 stop:1260 length:237 start_codon:yes stop_codon:yes gene_type:complete